MGFELSGDFFGDFKLGDNVVYNLDILGVLYTTQRQQAELADHLRKPIILILGSIAEALLHDLFQRIKHNTREGVSGIAKEVLLNERTKSRDKFETLIAGAKKLELLGDQNERFYDRLNGLRLARNRIHIQDTDRRLDRNERNVYTQDLQLEAEELVEVVIRTLAARFSRPTHAQGFVGVLKLPWNPHVADGSEQP